jgi:probable addiction module antidote protein
MAAYLEACLEEAPDDASYLAAALRYNCTRPACMVQLSRDAGISRDGLYKALSKDGNPTFDSVLKVVRALGPRFEAKAA